MPQEDPSPAAIEASKDRAAALTIQKNYRGYRTRRSLGGCALSADDRWGDAVLRLRREGAGKQNAEGSKNSAADRWRRGGLMVGQFAGSPASGGAEEGSKAGGEAGGGQVPDDGPVKGGPSLPDPEEQEEQHQQEVGKHTEPLREESHGLVGDVPGGQSDGKVDNVPSVAHQHEYGLKLLERWTRGAKATAASCMAVECSVRVSSSSRMV
ncbi:hypothetical protein IE81DRAFT_97818 [Ceraceosorus guamensis]|uniref:Uncharacterized protein n=1 Tax=Ceraceosorus guamensis TaxID=1522189 RepID=A0A316W304_9BASI|nr:hypothetical protein IE81DRAFT_97818 [Ceraceosorus guamensis]PWN43143.1 hypothetical protein IE81DRAFT_97818 [Ceraceosorus guamensis]